MRPIHFIVYLSRSGSTLLAKELNKFEDIAVGIEGFERQQLEYDPAYFLLKNDKELESWLTKVNSGKKEKNWELNNNELKFEISKIGYPVNFGQFLKIALNIHFKNNQAKVLLHKGLSASLFYDFESAEKIFPGSKYIYIDRDPRAIYSSQVRNRHSITGEKMTPDVISFVTKYRKLQSLLNHYKIYYSDKLIIVKYEDFIENKERELNRITSFLATSNQTNTESVYNVPEDQKYLHDNLEKNISDTYVNSWMNKLSKKEVYLLETLLKNELKSNTYKLSKIRYSELDNKGYVIRNINKYYRLKIYRKYESEIKNRFKRNFKKLIKKIKYKMYNVN